MKSKRNLLVFILCGMAVVPLTPGQTNAPQENMKVVVLDVHLPPAKPLHSVRVSLSYLDGSSRVTDAREVTNDKGEAFLQVSSGIAQHGDVRVEITGAGDLVIYQPADGQLLGLPTAVTINLVQKGSPVLLGPAQIEAMLHRTLLQINSLQEQNRILKKITAAAPAQKQDLSEALEEWARANGFPAAEVNKHVQQWAEDIQHQAGHSTLEQRALAEVALKHYGKAAQLFANAADADGAALDADEQAFLEDRRNKLEQLLADRQQSANALELNLQYHQATTTLEALRDRAAMEYKKHPDYRPIHELWLRTVALAARARRQEGEVTAERSLPLLAESADDLRGLLRAYGELGDGRQGAATQVDLGSTLLTAGIRATGESSTKLLADAAQAYRQALEMYPRDTSPRDWANTQKELGSVYVTQGERASGELNRTLFMKGLQAYQSILEVYTKADFPQEWANTQVDIGNALLDQGKRASGEVSRKMLTEAEKAYDSALSVYTKSESPQEWARAKSNLGLLFEEQGNRASGQDSVNFLDKAVHAFRASLEIFTKDGVPQDWARTNKFLGLALLDLATNGHNYGAYTSETTLDLMRQAEDADQQALEIFTETELPQDWGETKVNLGDVFARRSELAVGSSSMDLEKAADAFQCALRVFTREANPQAWASTEENLALMFKREGERVNGPESTKLIDEAATSFQQALKVYTKSEFPRGWAGVMGDLAGIYHDDSHDFQRAFEMNEEVVAVIPSLENRANFMEAALTDGQFGVCVDQAKKIDTGLNPLYSLVRDSWKLACQWGADDRVAALITCKSIVPRDTVLQKNVLDLRADIYYFSTSPAFASDRASWIALFTSLQNGDAPGMTAALHQLETLLQADPKTN